MDTPLHTAINKGHCDIAELLIKHNASVNAKDKVWCAMTSYLANAIQL